MLKGETKSDLYYECKIKARTFVLRRHQCLLVVQRLKLGLLETHKGDLHNF